MQLFLCDRWLRAEDGAVELRTGKCKALTPPGWALLMNRTRFSSLFFWAKSTSVLVSLSSNWSLSSCGHWLATVSMSGVRPRGCLCAGISEAPPPLIHDMIFICSSSSSVCLMKDETEDTLKQRRREQLQRQQKLIR